VIAALIARDGRVDWRELEFLERARILRMLGIERGHFMKVLSQHLGERLGGMAAGHGASAGQFDAGLDAIDDRTTQFVMAAALLYLADIDGMQAAEGELVRRAWERWNVTPKMLERRMRIPLARSRALYGWLPSPDHG
jgi:hypothetical protein